MVNTMSAQSKKNQRAATNAAPAANAASLDWSDETGDNVFIAHEGNFLYLCIDVTKDFGDVNGKGKSHRVASAQIPGRDNGGVTIGLNAYKTIPNKDRAPEAKNNRNTRNARDSGVSVRRY